MDQKKTWAELQAEKAAKAKPIKMMILGECHRIIQLLEADAETKRYGYDEESSAELFAKMHELRRDTINFEKLIK